MKVEGETAYEPDMLVLLERFEEVLGDTKKVWREATIIKDRSTLLDGKTFKNPGYADFAPAIEALLDSPMPKDAFLAPKGDTAVLFKTEESTVQWRRDKDKAMEELEGLLARIAPGATFTRLINCRPFGPPHRHDHHPLRIGRPARICSRSAPRTDSSKGSCAT
jgi:hypothetical protein